MEPEGKVTDMLPRLFSKLAALCAALMLAACSNSPDMAFTTTWPSALHTIHRGEAPSRR